MKSSIANPYAAGTANSSFFRIPALLTLKSGRIIACSDIRYGGGSDDPANIETAVRYSDDNGKTWSPIKLLNHFDDMEDADYKKAVPSSASFIDSAIAESKSGILYHVCDACPAYMGLWSEGTYGKGNGYIDGKLVLCDKTTSAKAESTTLDKEHYPYYIDNFGADGYAPVLKFSDGESYKAYYVDKFYNVYQRDNENLSPVLIKQMKKDGTVSEKDIIANIFYAHSPIKIYPTYYLWVRKSEDGGETWSEGKILNTHIKSKGFTGFAPGRGICIETNGKERIIFAVYDNNDGKEYASVIYTDDGENWHRSKRAAQVGEAGKSSETQFALMNKGVLRMYSRNTADYISYCDSTDGGKTWGAYTLDKDLKYCSNCQFSVINYSKKIDGKDAIIISYPSEKIRKCGAIKIGLYGEDNNVTWKYRKNITKSLVPFSFVYSCLTELPDGTVLDLYESDKFELTLSLFSVEELKTNDRADMNWSKRIKSKIYNALKK